MLFNKPKLRCILKISFNFFLCALVITSAIFPCLSSGNNTAKAMQQYSNICAGVKLSDCFPDKNFEKYVYKNVLKKSNWKSNQGQYILTDSDIYIITNATTELTFYTISSKDIIKDYTGIQNFKKLQQLFIQINCPTNLNLSNMEYLTNVIIYGFNSCNSKNGFTFTDDIYEEDIIDIMRSLPGIFFNSPYNSSNFLTNLSLDGCCSIKNLSILSYNNLTSFDYNLPNLRSLKILGSFIDKLDLGKCPKLRELICLGLPINEISNVSLSLKEAIFEQTNLENIDLSNHINLTKFICVNNPNLKIINLSNCINLNYEILTIKNSPSLEKIFISINSGSPAISSNKANHSSNISDIDTEDYSIS